MGMKIQAINTGDGLSVEVGKVYLVDSDEVTGNYKVTHIEVISAPTAAGVEVRVEIEVRHENPARLYRYLDVSIDCILEDAN